MITTSDAYRQAIYQNGRYTTMRITLTLDGTTKTYNDEQIVSVNVVEEMSIINENSSTNECTIVFDNQDGAFSYLKLENYDSIIEKKPLLTLECGLELADESIEYVRLGLYSLHEWTSDKKNSTVTLICRDEFETLANTNIPTLTSNTLFNLATSILSNAGITSYELDNELKNYSGVFPDSTDSRTALQQIAQATRCTLYQDRFGKILIKQMQFSNLVTSYPSDSFFPGSTTYTTVDNTYGIRNIEQEYMYDFPNVAIERKIKEINFTLNDSSYIVKNGSVAKGDSYSVDNPFITTTTHANNVASWIFTTTNQPETYDFEWKQNMCLEPGDIVIVEDNTERNRQSVITKQEFTYAGYLRGRTTSKGGF